MKSKKLLQLGQRRRAAKAVAEVQQPVKAEVVPEYPDLPELPTHEESLKLGLSIARADGTPTAQLAALREINRFHEARAKAGNDAIDKGLSEEERLQRLNAIFGEAQE